MADFSVELRGFAQLERDWLQLAGDLGPAKARTTLNRPVRQAIEMAADEIRENTPVDSGDLQRSVRTNSGRANRKELRSGVFDPNDVVVARAGWFWRGESMWFQALAVEYGTSQQAPRMVLRDALRNNADAMLGTLRRGIREAIMRRVARFSRTGR